MRTNLITNKPLPIRKKRTATATATSDSMLDMVIAFDTTGSMSRYIGAVRKHCTDLVPKLLAANPDMRIGIVAFGDYCDMNSSTDFGNAYQVLPLTDNREKIIKFINDAKNTGGGDDDEFYELVIKKITEETDWREGATKAVLLIADAAPHSVGYTCPRIVKNAQIDWREEARKAAEKGIKFDTLSIHGTEWYKELSAITNGTYAPFKSSEKTAQVVEASVLSKVAATRGAFKATMDSVMLSSDSEMKAVYSAYSKEVL